MINHGVWPTPKKTATMGDQLSDMCCSQIMKRYSQDTLGNVHRTHLSPRFQAFTPCKTWSSQPPVALSRHASLLPNTPHTRWFNWLSKISHNRLEQPWCTNDPTKGLKQPVHPSDPSLDRAIPLAKQKLHPADQILHPWNTPTDLQYHGKVSRFLFLSTKNQKLLQDVGWSIPDLPYLPRNLPRNLPFSLGRSLQEICELIWHVGLFQVHHLLSVVGWGIWPDRIWDTMGYSMG